MRGRLRKKNNQNKLGYHNLPRESIRWQSLKTDDTLRSEFIWYHAAEGHKPPHGWSIPSRKMLGLNSFYTSWKWRCSLWYTQVTRVLSCSEQCMWYYIDGSETYKHKHSFQHQFAWEFVSALTLRILHIWDSTNSGILLSPVFFCDTQSTQQVLDTLDKDVANIANGTRRNAHQTQEPCCRFMCGYHYILKSSSVIMLVA